MFPVHATLIGFHELAYFIICWTFLNMTREFACTTHGYWREILWDSVSRFAWRDWLTQRTEPCRERVIWGTMRDSRYCEHSTKVSKLALLLVMILCFRCHSDSRFGWCSVLCSHPPSSPHKPKYLSKLWLSVRSTQDFRQKFRQRCMNTVLSFNE